MRRRDGSTISGDLLIESLAPGLFSANASGQGVGLLGATLVSAAGAQAAIPVYTYDSTQQKHVPVPISLGGATDQVYLILYGTGIRGVEDVADVRVRVGDEEIPAQYAGEQSEFAGLDQVNVGPLPKTLAGAGEVEVELRINSRRANRVTLNIK